MPQCRQWWLAFSFSFPRPLPYWIHQPQGHIRGNLINRSMAVPSSTVFFRYECRPMHWSCILPTRPHQPLQSASSPKQLVRWKTTTVPVSMPTITNGNTPWWMLPNTVGLALKQQGGATTSKYGWRQPSFIILRQQLVTWMSLMFERAFNFFNLCGKASSTFGTLLAVSGTWVVEKVEINNK